MDPVMSGVAMAMDTTISTLFRNARMADATPRRSTLTGAMTVLVSGGWKRPDPTLFTNIQAAITGYWVSYFIVKRPKKPTCMKQKTG